MLQQILRDMYIDPELLAELDETQKQTLFCRMREEQIRRWRIWDQQEMETLKSRPPAPKPTPNRRHVQWLLNDKGEPWVVIIGEQDVYSDDDEDCDDISTNVVNGGNMSSSTVQKPEHCVNVTDIKSNQNRSSEEQIQTPEVNGDPSGINCSLKHKQNPSSPVTFKCTSKRDALQELSLNKVQNVAKRVAEWEQRVNEQINVPATNKLVNDKKAQETTMRVDEEEEDKMWREQQKKAKEAEIRMRTIARRAREEHRRSLIEQNGNFMKTNISSSNYSQVTIVNDKPAYLPDMKKPPPNKEAVIRWFKTRELLRGAGFDSVNNSPAAWFHGLITRQESESLLSDKGVGTFLVRISEKIWGYAISYKDYCSCKHYLVDASNGHYRFFGADTIHMTLNDLVSYHSVKPITVTGGEILQTPCCSNKDISDMFRS